MIKRLFKKIRQLERRYIPHTRNKVWYNVIKGLMLLPILIVGLLSSLVYGSVIRKIKLKRNNKPDIVLENIIAGWTNLAFSSPAVEKLAIKRAKICAECPSAVISGTYSIIAPDNKTKAIKGLKCNVCGCALSAKVRATDDTCPLGKW